MTHAVKRGALAEFLSARLDEQVKRAALDEQLGHISLDDYALRTAEVNAVRKVADLARSTDSHEIHADAWTLAKWALRTLAVPYADHPDYDESWRP